MTAAPNRPIELLEELGLLQPGETATVEPLTGGVSSDIVVVTTPTRRYCVKFALEQLKVAAVWKAPVHRNAADYDWLAYAAAIDPSLVPELFGRSTRLGGFAMAFLEPADYPNWKSQLLAGKVDVAFAGAVGAALGRVHARAAGDRAGRARFANQADFMALRLDPYLNFTATRHPDLAPKLAALVARQTAARIALVHGDVSPKNVLAGPRGPVILDAECAVEGDPAFDVAFCLNHLVIKAMAGLASPRKLAASARAFWAAYAQAVDWEPVVDLEARVAELLPALMLARVDGKSPVEYLDETQRIGLRHLARQLLLAPPVWLEDIIGKAETIGNAR